MTDFKTKMHQIRFRLWLRTRLRWGSLQRSPRPSSWIWGPLCSRGRGWAGIEEGKGEGGGVEGREREGPSEPCYATASIISPNVEILAWITSKNVNVLYISNVLWR